MSRHLARWPLEWTVFAIVSFLLTIIGFLALRAHFETWEKIDHLDKVELFLYAGSQKAKWLHFKVLELATRSINAHDIFVNQYRSHVTLLLNTVLQIETVLPEWHQLDGSTGLVTMLLELRSLNAQRLSDDALAIDGSACTQWGTFDCFISVPGVASNTDITVLASEGKEACDRLDRLAGGVCEWMPDRPDVIPGPQPSNLMNKCVCYACKGPLPTGDFADRVPGSLAWLGSSLGADGRYQCENDPRYRDACTWDGLNCVAKVPQPSPSVLNTSAYMSRHSRMSHLLLEMEQEFHACILANIHSVSECNVRILYLTIGAAMLQLFVVGTQVLWLLRRRQKVRLGWVYYTTALVFLSVGMAALVMLNSTALHLTGLMDVLRSDIHKYGVSWDVMYYDAILTTSASRFVETAHNTGWIDEGYTGVRGGIRVFDHWFIQYTEIVGFLDAAVNFMISAASSSQELNAFQEIDKVNKLLVDLEQMALCSCEPPDVSALAANDTTMGRVTLYSPTYLAAKDTYNMMVTDIHSIQMQRLRARFHEIITKALMFLISCVFVIVFLFLMLWELTRQLAGRRSNCMLELKMMEDRVQTCLSNTVGIFAHPLLTMRASDFKLLGRMASHEEARGWGLLRTFDTPRSTEGHRILFVTHEWLGRRHPDPSGVQFGVLCRAIDCLLAQDCETGTQAELHIWLDYHSIPQKNDVSVGVGAVAILSIVNFAMYSTAMCVIAPDAKHEDGRSCGLPSYMRRGWCRAEQCAYLLTHGFSNFYISDVHGFRRVGELEETSKDCLFWAEGDFRCCACTHTDCVRCDREVLVDPMLYLYYLARHGGCEFLHSQTFRDRALLERDRIFPSHVAKAVGSASTICPLFHGLISVIEDMEPIQEKLRASWSLHDDDSLHN